jgi:hypothetical protein
MTVEDDLVDMLAKEIAKEIDREVYRNIMSYAPATTKWTPVPTQWATANDMPPPWKYYMGEIECDAVCRPFYRDTEYGFITDTGETYQDDKFSDLFGSYIFSKYYCETE